MVFLSTIWGWFMILKSKLKCEPSHDLCVCVCGGGGLGGGGGGGGLRDPEYAKPLSK